MFKGECFAKENDEVSRLSVRFALMHPHGYWMMFKWSDLGRLREYLFIELKHGMPRRVLAFDNQWLVRAWSGQLRQNLKVTS